jgi:hypothetical protein
VRAEDDAERQRTGRKRRGREPGPIVVTPSAKVQTNFTDPAMSIMRTANNGMVVLRRGAGVPR